MTDLPYVAAAYAVVIATLIGYTLRLRHRLDRARRRRAAIARNVRPVTAVRPVESAPETR